MIFGRRNLILMLILVAFLVATYVLLFLPALRGILEKKTFVESSTSRLSTIYIQSSPFQKIVRDLEQADASISGIYADIFIRRDNELAFIQFLNQIAEPSMGLKLAFDMNKLTEKRGQEVAPLKIEMQTTWPRFMEYLKALETSPYYVIFETVSVNRTPQRQGKEPLVFATINGYVLTGARSQTYESDREED